MVLSGRHRHACKQHAAGDLRSDVHQRLCRRIGRSAAGTDAPQREGQRTGDGTQHINHLRR